VKRRVPRPIAVAVESLTRSLAPSTPLAAAQRAWPDAVGPQIAAAAQPQAERGGVLTVACQSATWAQEIALLAPELIASLNAALGREAIGELRCTAVPPGE